MNWQDWGEQYRGGELRKLVWCQCGARADDFGNFG
jgi:hypothetical protein